MAHVQQSRRARKYHHPAAAAQITRAEPGRKHLAVLAGKLALKPRLQVLRGHRRTLLLRLENPPEPPMEHHVDRQTQMGTRVLINDGWYYIRHGEGIRHPQGVSMKNATKLDCGLQVENRCKGTNKTVF